MNSRNMERRMKRPIGASGGEGKVTKEDTGMVMTRSKIGVVIMVGTGLVMVVVVVVVIFRVVVLVVTVVVTRVDEVELPY